MEHAHCTCSHGVWRAESAERKRKPRSLCECTERLLCQFLMTAAPVQTSRTSLTSQTNRTNPTGQTGAISRILTRQLKSHVKLQTRMRERKRQSEKQQRALRRSRLRRTSMKGLLRSAGKLQNAPR